MARKRNIILSSLAAIGMTISTVSCGATDVNYDMLECEELIDDFADYTTDKNCKKICSLIFTDEMVEDCNVLYYTEMKLQITNRNLIFKQSFGDLFESIKYEFTDTSFSELSDDNLEITKAFYADLGYTVGISEGYWVSSTFSSSAGYEYNADFAVVKIDDEWKISPQIWLVTFGQKLEPLRKVFTEEDFYSIL